MSSPVPRPEATHQQSYRMDFDFPQGVARAAVGLITCVTNANMADTDIVTIGDGLVAAKVYEYDKSGNGVTGGRVAWAVAGGAGAAADVAATLKTAIEANQPAIEVTDNADGTLTLRHKIPGLVGNVTITEVVANAGFLVAGMTGGAKGHAITADTTIKLWKPPAGNRAIRVDRVQLLLPDGLTAHASNFANFKLIQGSTVMANWSTETGQNGTLTANTPADMTLGTLANRSVADAVQISLFVDVTGTPLVLPGRVIVDFTEL